MTIADMLRDRYERLSSELTGVRLLPLGAPDAHEVEGALPPMWRARDSSRFLGVYDSNQTLQELVRYGVIDRFVEHGYEVTIASPDGGALYISAGARQAAE